MDNLSGKTSEAIISISKQINNNSKSIVPRSSAALSKTAAKTENLKELRTGLDIIGQGAIKSTSLIIKTAGTSFANKAYEDRKQK